MDSSLREKLEKIKRLMEGAVTVGEAEAATAAMQRLILKHNLTAEQVASLDATIRREEYSSDYIRVGEKRSQGLQWRLNLLWLLAEYNFCAFIRYGHHGGDGVLVGQKSNKDAVRMMFDATVSTIERIADSEWYLTRNDMEQLARAGYPTANGWKNSFKHGFVVGLRTKIRLERKSEVLGDGRVSALVSLKEVELKEAVDTHVGKTSNHSGSAPTNSAGYFRGVEKGRVHEFNERIG